MTKRPLTKKQISALAVIASQAWRQAGFSLAYDCADDFRHAVCFDVTGKDSFRRLTQAEYVPVWNAFAAYAGKPLRPDRTPDAHAVAVKVLERHMRRHELSVAYVAAVARDKFNIAPAEPGELAALCAGLAVSQVWQLVYTINTRGRAKTRKLARQIGMDETPPEPHESYTMPPGTLAAHMNAVEVSPLPAPARRQRARKSTTNAATT